MNDTYLTLRSAGKGLYREKGSRFISLAYPVKSLNEIKEIIERLRREYHDARHQCYAYMIGHERLTWRINDDREPSGTAGKPILGVINSYGLTDILIVVIRYFGGTLLGTGGLINAYRTAAENAIKNCEIIEAYVCESIRLKFQYNSLNEVMKILKEEDIRQFNHCFDIECSITISIRLSIKDAVINRLSAISGLKWEKVPPENQTDPEVVN